MHKFLKTSLSIALISTLLSGCNATKELNSILGIPNSPQEYIDKSTDKYLAKTFTNQYFDNKKIHLSKVNNNYIKMDTKTITFYDQVSQYNALDTIGMKYENDSILSLYKNAIIKRGNTFKIYKSYMNEKLFRKAFNIQGNLKKRDDIAKYAYDWTPTIIEYDSKNNIISAMIRYQEIAVAYNNFNDPNAPVQIESHVYVLTGYKARSLKNKIKNSEFINYEM